MDLIIVILTILFFFIMQFFSDRPFKIAVISPSFLMVSFTLVILIFHIFFQEKSQALLHAVYTGYAGTAQSGSSGPLSILAALGVISVLALILVQAQTVFLYRVFPDL